jgi:hypothetical protein
VRKAQGLSALQGHVKGNETDDEGTPSKRYPSLPQCMYGIDITGVGSVATCSSCGGERRRADRRGDGVHWAVLSRPDIFFLSRLHAWKAD